MKLFHQFNVAWVVIHVGGAAAVGRGAGGVAVLVPHLIFHAGVTAIFGVIPAMRTKYGVGGYLLSAFGARL